MLFWDWVFVVAFTLIGLAVLIIGIAALWNRISTRRHFKSTDAGYFLSVFLILLGAFVSLSSSVYVPMALSDQRVDNDQFRLWCAEQGGTVLDITNQPYECWKTKLGAN